MEGEGFKILFLLVLFDSMSTGHLYFVGLGLYDTTDISVKAVEILKECETVFAEFYTARLGGFNKQHFEQMIGGSVQILSRSEVESGEKILHATTQGSVGFLVCGDPMMATTHVDLRMRAEQKGIHTSVIHNASIVTAVPGLLGLQNYKFGRTTTLAYPEGKYFPTSPYEVILHNQSCGLHTLVLLDIQQERQRYMTAKEGLSLLLKMEQQKQRDLFTDDTLVCVVARAGSSDSVCMAHTIQHMISQDFGPPLHTIVVPGSLHFMELEALESFAQLPPSVSTQLQKQS